MLAAVKPMFFASPGAFRTWLEANHATKTELLVGYYKTSTKKPSLSWSESVDEALCFGWIDGVRKSYSDEAYTIRFTPRKPTSVWSEINVAKVAALREAKKMRPAGEAAFAKRTAAKTYSGATFAAARLSSAELAQFPAQARDWFTSQAPSYRQGMTYWVASAKKDETRAKRLAELIDYCARGEKHPRLVKYTKPTKAR